MFKQKITYIYKIYMNDCDELAIRCFGALYLPVLRNLPAMIKHPEFVEDLSALVRDLDKDEYNKNYIMIRIEHLAMTLMRVNNSEGLGTDKKTVLLWQELNNLDF